MCCLIRFRSLAIIPFFLTVGGTALADEFQRGDPPVPPGIAVGDHAAPKHRYLSINPSTNGTATIGLKVKLVGLKRCTGEMERSCTADTDCKGTCALDPTIECDKDSNCGANGPCNHPPCVQHADVGTEWWVDEPEEEPLGCLPKHCDTWDGAECLGDSQCGGAPGSCARRCQPTDQFARLSAAPSFRGWADARFPLTTLHVGDCEVIPAATYEIRACIEDPATGEIVCGDALTISTIEQPFLAPGFRANYGDVAGPVSLGNFAPPDGIANVTDVSAYLKTVQNYGVIPLKLPQVHPTWIDTTGLGAGNPPQFIINVADLQVIRFGITGKTWVDFGGNLNPAACP